VDRASTMTDEADPLRECPPVTAEDVVTKMPPSIGPTGLVEMEDDLRFRKCETPAGADSVVGGVKDILLLLLYR
jgi:hypothetical protein